jgi:voltage-dependent potassium channel beta subunit
MVEASSDKPKMIYRYLGNSGLKVSVIGYGNWVNGHDAKAQEFTTQCIKAAFDAGVNFYDTAEIYGTGQAEILMGVAFKELGLRREDLVVSTKILSCGNGVNDKFMSRKHIIEGLDNSLKRLQLDYVDVVFSHRPDYETSLEETCAAYHHVIEQGKAFYWGTSEWPASRIMAAIGICEKNGWHKPIVEQPQYNMLVRKRFEGEYAHLFAETGYGTTIWSPLAMGLLTGKYDSGEIPEGSRFSLQEYLGSYFKKYFGEGEKEKTQAKFAALKEIATELGGTQAQLALAWACANKDVSVALCGFTKMEQFEDNIGALKMLEKWTPEIEARVNAILNNAPEAEINFRERVPIPNRRVIQLYSAKK